MKFPIIKKIPCMLCQKTCTDLDYKLSNRIDISKISVEEIQVLLMKRYYTSGNPISSPMERVQLFKLLKSPENINYDASPKIIQRFAKL